MTVVQGIKTGTNVRYQNPGPGRIQTDDGGGGGVLVQQGHNS